MCLRRRVGVKLLGVDAFKNNCLNQGWAIFFGSRAVLKIYLALRATLYKHTMLDIYILTSYLVPNSSKNTLRAGQEASEGRYFVYPWLKPSNLMKTNCELTIFTCPYFFSILKMFLCVGSEKGYIKQLIVSITAMIS